MRFVSLCDILPSAKKEHYAIPQINMNSVKWAERTLMVAQRLNSPIIIGTSDRLIEFLGGFELIVNSVQLLMKQNNITIPVVLHLDHGSSFERCKQAIDAGYSSVMYDGSHYSIEENISVTKEVVAYAHARNVSVEAEVGTVGGNEDGMIGEVFYAKVEECLRLVEEAKIDALAAALGSVHGHYKGKPNLSFERMQELEEKSDIPLVLHGGSGIPKEDIQQAILYGHAKINVNTECMQAYVDAMRTTLVEKPHIYEYRIATQSAYAAIDQIIEQKINLFGSVHRSIVLN